MSDMRKSELSKWGLNELCCKRTVYRWNRLELNFPSMYGTGAVQPEQKSPVRGVLSNTVLVYTVYELSIFDSEFPANFDAHSIQPRHCGGSRETAVLRVYHASAANRVHYSTVQ